MVTNQAASTARPVKQERNMNATSTRGKSSKETRSDAMSASLAENWWMVALRGVLAIIFGAIALLVPVATMLSLLLIFAAYMLVDGIFAIIAAVRAARQSERWGLLVLQGILSIAVAAITVVWPGITLIAYVLLVAVWALVSGTLMIAAASQLNKDHGRWWLGLGGALFIVWGILLIIAPLIGALVMTWWLGIWAIVFGVSLIALAFKLRSQQQETGHKPVAQRA
jgi:uncharacterized membrane protein HdeD (DUF308 family)